MFVCRVTETDQNRTTLISAVSCTGNLPLTTRWELFLPCMYLVRSSNTYHFGIKGQSPRAWSSEPCAKNNLYNSCVLWYVYQHMFINMSYCTDSLVKKQNILQNRHLAFKFSNSQIQSDRSVFSRLSQVSRVYSVCGPVYCYLFWLALKTRAIL